MQGHAINRTSPKGQKFVGTCMRCGRSGLTLADMNKRCENIAGMSEEEALLNAIDPDRDGDK